MEFTLVHLMKKCFPLVKVCFSMTLMETSIKEIGKMACRMGGALLKMILAATLEFGKLVKRLKEHLPTIMVKCTWVRLLMAARNAG